MALSRELLSLCAVLEDKHDELCTALALFDSGLGYLDGSDPHVLNELETNHRGFYLLGLYQREVQQILEDLKKEIDYLSKVLLSPK